MFLFILVHDGDYYRLLTPGEYEVMADQEGYQPQTQRVTVTESHHQPAQRLDFKLSPLPPVSLIFILKTVYVNYLLLLVTLVQN